LRCDCQRFSPFSPYSPSFVACLLSSQPDSPDFGSILSLFCSFADASGVGPPCPTTNQVVGHVFETSVQATSSYFRSSFSLTNLTPLAGAIFFAGRFVTSLSLTLTKRLRFPSLPFALSTLQHSLTVVPPSVHFYFTRLLENFRRVFAPRPHFYYSFPPFSQDDLSPISPSGNPPPFFPESVNPRPAL